MNSMFVSILFLSKLVHIATSTPHDDRHNDEFFFDRQPGHKLSVSSKNVTSKTIQVQEKMDCVFACVRLSWCRSINHKIVSDSSGLQDCELLSIDKLNQVLTEDEKYAHLSIENPCAKVPCLNGGTCTVEYNRRDYRCQCTPGYTGEKCQNASSIQRPQFKGNSYMAFSPTAFNIRLNTNIVIKFIPYKESGLLFYVTSNHRDFLSVSLHNGFVQYRYNLGHGIDPKQSQRNIALNTEHTSIVTRYRNTGTLKVDDEAEISVRSPGTTIGLETSSSLYLGGFPQRSLVKPSAVADIKSLKGLDGCVTYVAVNGIPLNLTETEAVEKRNIGNCLAPY